MGAQFDVLFYDLTSTCFEGDAPEDDQDPRRLGCSRDKRSDCVPVPVIVARVVTSEALPPTGEMFPGNTADKTTLRQMIELIQKRHGQTERIWVMDQGIPTEAVLEVVPHPAGIETASIRRTGLRLNSLRHNADSRPTEL